MMMNENEMARFVRKAIDGYFKDLDGEKARGVYDMVINSVEKPLLDATLSERYRYPDAAYRTVRVAAGAKLTPDLPTKKVVANAIGIELPGIVLPHRRVEMEPANDWESLLDRYGLSFVSVVERHGKSDGRVAHGLLQDFGIRDGAVCSSVGHDSHNLIVAGSSEAQMRLALDTVVAANGGICVVHDGAVTAFVPLPIAGLLSDKRVTEVAEETRHLKAAWDHVGCKIPYMGFNLIPLSVIPELRITDMGLVAVPSMAQLRLFEPA